MADVYKNIFGSVCSIPIMERIAQGQPLPDDPAKQKRLLSKAWFPPISYRTFQNALQGKNELGRMLARKHADPLHKTFLIMDEVHKLLDGDLGAQEQADFQILQNYIHASYATSKYESVRPLLMTATPITDSPKDLFAMLNTLIDQEANRLMPFEAFRDQFADEHGTISYEGQVYFMEKAKGLISYLNREYDPTTFAQPVFHKVTVRPKGSPTPTAREVAEACGASNKTAKRKDVRSCYNATKQQYKTRRNQLQAIEECFGQPPKFPTFQEVVEA
jgi:hypothetical protein